MPYEEDPQPQGLAPLAFLAAVGAGVVGAAVWGAIAYFTNYEVGYVAWGIGALIGIAAAVAGGRGVPVAGFAAVMALVSIFGGKMAAAHFSLEKAIGAVEFRGLYDEYERDAADLQELPDSPSDEELATYIVEHGYFDVTDAIAVTEDELESFRGYYLPMLDDFHAAPPPFDEWEERQRAETRASFLAFYYEDPEASLVDMVIKELAGMDLIFALLGVATAWTLVMRASV